MQIQGNEMLSISEWPNFYSCLRNTSVNFIDYIDSYWFASNPKKHQFKTDLWELDVADVKKNSTSQTDTTWTWQPFFQYLHFSFIELHDQKVRRLRLHHKVLFPMSQGTVRGISEKAWNKSWPQSGKNRYQRIRGKADQYHFVVQLNA